MPTKNMSITLTKGMLTSLLTGKEASILRADALSKDALRVRIKLAKEVDPMGGSFFRWYKQTRREKAAGR